MNHLKRQLVVAPSILSADFAILKQQCLDVINHGVQSLHIDIMDGHFVPNLTFGAPVVACLRKHLPNIHFDCHLMVTYPQHYLQPLSKANINCFTFHYQSQYQDLKQLCQSIRSHKIQVGISIKPKTQIDSTIENIISEGLVDKLLVMTVQPGFGGQKFMSDMMRKVQYLRGKFPELDIQVDGGIGVENAQLVAKAGANCLVCGSSIFAAQDRAIAFKSISQNAQKGLSSLS